MVIHGKTVGRTTPRFVDVAGGKEASEKALDKFGILVGAVTMLATKVDAAEVIRSLDTSHTAPPRNPNRALVRDGFCWVAVPRDIGLARDMPCRLLLFIDGLALCVLNPAIGGSSKVCVFLFLFLNIQFVISPSVLKTTSPTQKFRSGRFINGLEEKKSWT